MNNSNNKRLNITNEISLLPDVEPKKNQIKIKITLPTNRIYINKCKKI